MKVKLTSPAEGKQPGETVDVDEGRAKWLIAEGYGTGDKEPKPKAAPKPAKAEATKTEATKTD